MGSPFSFPSRYRSKIVCRATIESVIIHPDHGSNFMADDVAEVRSMRKASGVSKAFLWSAAGAGLLMFAKAQSVRAGHLRGKVALITGGSRGLGLLLARHLASEGVRIAICARDEQELADARQDLQQRGADVFT